MLEKESTLKKMEAIKTMSKYSLIKELNAVKVLTKSSRDKISRMIVKDQSVFQSLLEIAFDYNNELSSKACSVLESVCEERPDWIAFNLNYFTENLPNVQGDSNVRSISKICNMIAQNYNSKFDSPIKLIITEDQVSQLIETCFEWLLSDYKVATKANAMETLYHIGKQIGWIHYELKMIIEKNIPVESPGYTSRAKKVLEAISKDTAA